LHRSDHDYNEAIKAYKQALKVEPQNLQILRDLSMLQIQLRDTTGFAITRNTLLTIKPNAKINWMAFALARHMSGDLPGAINVIDIYLGTLTEGSSDLGRSYESSELAMYKNSIIAEIPNNYMAALEHLDTCETIVVDRGAWLLKRLEYELKLQQYQNAQQTIYQLFDRGMTENHTIHSLLMCQLLQINDSKLIDEVLRLRGTQTLATYIPLTEEQKQIIYQAYQNDLQNMYPKSYAIQRIPITVMDDEQFRHHIDIRCRKDLRRGVPSLCHELKSYLWTLNETTNRFVRTTDPVDIHVHVKYQMFVQLVDAYIHNLESCSKFSMTNGVNGETNEDAEEEPSTLFWAWYLRAGLHEMVGQYAKGLEFIEKCIHHTPTSVDAYELKASLLKQCGNIVAAVQCLDYGRDLDRADRYLNNQTTKYMLQANMEQEALQRISMFTRHEGNPEQNLYDMQCSWYELELAACHGRKMEYGKSLKKYHAVIQHFHDFQEDQFDFHSYCLRKVTLRAYVSVLRYEDVIFGQEFFCTAAEGTIRIYLHLYDVPTSNETEEPDYSKMDAAERKKAKAVARKKKKAATTITTTKENETTLASSNGTATPTAAAATKVSTTKGKGATTTTTTTTTAAAAGTPTHHDDDPLGHEYLKKDPLNEAKKYVQMLTKYAPQSISTWILQYDVSMRRKKFLLALQALCQATKLDPYHAELFTRMVDFVKNIDQYCTSTNTSSVVRTVIAKEVPALLHPAVSVDDYIIQAQCRIRNDAFMDVPFRMAVVKASLEMTTTANPTMTIPEAVQYIVDYGGIDTARQVTYDTCHAAWELLQRLGPEASDAAQQWENEMTLRYPKVLHGVEPSAEEKGQRNDVDSVPL
jgi:N-alpha-acetyltransferase 15/16, NatA auxiliary subunit